MTQWAYTILKLEVSLRYAILISQPALGDFAVLSGFVVFHEFYLLAWSRTRSNGGKVGPDPTLPAPTYLG